MCSSFYEALVKQNVLGHRVPVDRSVQRTPPMSKPWFHPWTFLRIWVTLPVTSLPFNTLKGFTGQLVAKDVFSVSKLNIMAPLHLRSKVSVAKGQVTLLCLFTIICSIITINSLEGILVWEWVRTKWMLNWWMAQEADVQRLREKDCPHWTYYLRLFIWPICDGMKSNTKVQLSNWCYRECTKWLDGLQVMLFCMSSPLGKANAFWNLVATSSVSIGRNGLETNAAISSDV